MYSAVDPVQAVGPTDLELWANKHMTRDEAARVLDKYVACLLCAALLTCSCVCSYSIGSYLLRKGSDGSLVLVVKGKPPNGETTIKNYKITYEDGHYFIKNDTKVYRFRTVPELVEHYRDHDIKKKGGLVAQLRTLAAYPRH